MTILAIAESLGGVAAMLIGLYLLNAVDEIASSVGLGPGNIPDFVTFFGGEVGFGALAILIGFGLWQGKRWGRPLAVYAGVAALVYCIGFGAYFLATYNDFTETEATLALLLVSLAAVYYLEGGKTKAYFDSLAQPSEQI